MQDGPNFPSSPSFRFVTGYLWSSVSSGSYGARVSAVAEEREVLQQFEQASAEGESKSGAQSFASTEAVRACRGPDGLTISRPFEEAQQEEGRETEQLIGSSGSAASMVLPSALRKA